MNQDPYGKPALQCLLVMTSYSEDYECILLLAPMQELMAAFGDAKHA